MTNKVKTQSGSKVKKSKGSTPRRNKATPFKVVDVEESDEAFHKKMMSSGKKKRKKDENGINDTATSPPIELLVKDTEEQFDSNDIDEEYSDNESDGGDYENFMEEMAKLDGKKRKITSDRSEGTGDISEYNLSSHKSSKVELTSLLSALNSETDVRTLSRRLEGDQGELPVPLERPQAERVAREAGYTGVKKDISVWDAVVHSRRAADQVSFPLKKPDLKLKSVGEDKERFKAETPLEQQVAALLAGSKAVIKDGEEYSEVEKKGLEGMTVREALERKAELSKIRALQTYQEAKFRRQGKIKSKKYRKIERKMKSKEKLAELEELTRNNPEAAAEKLAELDKIRIEERASLKHRNASKFLQEQAKMSKKTKNKEAKLTMREQLAQHRELLTKHGEAFDDTVEDESGKDLTGAINLNCELLSRQDETVAEFNAGYKKFWEEEQAKKKLKATEDLEEIFDEAEYDLRQKNLIKIDALKKAQSGRENEEVMEEGDVEEKSEELIPSDSLNFKVRPDSDQNIVKLNKDLNKNIGKEAETTSLPNVDPDNFINVEPKDIGSDLPEIIGYNELEDDEDQRDIIAEAFADDDVVESFKAEKAALIEAKKPKDIDLTLPGWGEWGGGGAVPSKRKRKRFTIKAPPVHKRKDENSGHLILNTDKDEKLRTHQVNNVPFPFTSVSDFEASVRAPVGATFIPRTAHLKMVKPRVKTKAGEVIEPMDREQLVRRGIVKPMKMVGANGKEL